MSETTSKRLDTHFYLIERLRTKIHTQREELIDLKIRVAGLESLMRKIDVHNHELPDPLASLFEQAPANFNYRETGQYFHPLGSHLHGKRSPESGDMPKRQNEGGEKVSAHDDYVQRMEERGLISNIRELPVENDE